MNDYASPRWTTELVDCSMPMTFDTYSNCAFSCLYCFSQYRRAIGNSKDAYLNKEVSAVNVERIKRMFLNPDEHGGQFAEYIKRRKVMQWGGLSDEFDGFERKHGRTLELLRFFKEINYPLCFSTKGTFFTEDEAYMELIRGQKNWNFKFSIITPDERKAHIIEKGVPSPAERLKAIERIAEAGAGGATLRLRPFILGISTPGYLDLIQQAHDAGATAVSTEFLCIERRSLSLRKVMPIINELCGFDLYDFYIKHSPGAGYLRLSETVKRPFYANMKQLCDKIGMRFYVSDAHWKELCCNGSCCWLGKDWNYSRGQFCEALQIAKEKGTVRWSDIAGPNAEIFSKVKYIGAQGLNTVGSENRAKFDGMTLYDYMRYLWNTPKAGSSPYKLFFGVIEPCGHDDQGDIIYKYKGRQ